VFCQLLLCVLFLFPCIFLRSNVLMFVLQWHNSLFENYRTCYWAQPVTWVQGLPRNNRSSSATSIGPKAAEVMRFCVLAFLFGLDMASLEVWTFANKQWLYVGFGQITGNESNLVTNDYNLEVHFNGSLSVISHLLGYWLKLWYHHHVSVSISVSSKLLRAHQHNHSWLLTQRDP
jgi:hypothetical protein